MAISTPLGPDVLLLHKLHLQEEMNRPFVINTSVFSLQSGISPEDVLGLNATIRLNLPRGGQRFLNGIISSFHQVGFLQPLAHYELKIIPWLGLLELGADCRIFQQQKAPDITKAVFSILGFNDYEYRLSAEYPAHGITTQYNESHLNFVSRLLEHEGIGFYFDHEKDRHNLVLADSISAYEPFPAYEAIPFNPKDSPYEGQEFIRTLRLGQSIATGIHTLRDWDYMAPKNTLEGTASGTQTFPHGNIEKFHFPGGYDSCMEPDSYARIRQEEALTASNQIAGEAISLGITAGHTLTISNLNIENFAKQFLVTKTTLEAQNADYLNSPGQEAPLAFKCSFQALDTDFPYRPPRLCKKPIIPGPQTARVTGPAGNNPKVPFVSPIGSVKVQFNWDRKGRDNDSSSGWIRVAQPHAGPGYGAMFCPRIGNEVVVLFENGDPDRPIIVGSAYNRDNMPTLPLPHFAQRSYFHDDGGNALCFTPEKGNESIVMYSPFNDTMRVVGASDEAGYEHIPTQPGFP